MDPELRPRVPFVGWPAHWFDRRYGFVWIVDAPAAIVTQTIQTHASAAGIEALHDILDEITDTGFVADNPGLVIIHDWRAIRTYDANARDTWTRRSDRPGRPFATVGSGYIAVGSSAMIRMAVAAGALAIQLATGQPPIKVIEDPAVPLESLGIRAPARESVRKLRRANRVR